MRKDNIPKERKPKQRRICYHTKLRDVLGRSNEVLWRECIDCRFDFPLIGVTKGKQY